MIKILFVCHGNICRSAMAEFIMKKIVQDEGLAERFYIESAATSREEIGNDLYPPAKAKLREKGIPFSRHYARQVTKKDYGLFDVILLMDENNRRNIKKIIPNNPDHKIHKLLEHDIADPWYTDDFETCYEQLFQGCRNWMEKLTYDL
jgi:protein-tyrosine phosphatase